MTEDSAQSRSAQWMTKRAFHGPVKRRSRKSPQERLSWAQAEGQFGAQFVPADEGNGELPTAPGRPHSCNQPHPANCRGSHPPVRENVLSQRALRSPYLSLSDIMPRPIRMECADAVDHAAARGKERKAIYRDDAIAISSPLLENRPVSRVDFSDPREVQSP
jgi:hypothetical protein